MDQKSFMLDLHRFSQPKLAYLEKCDIAPATKKVRQNHHIAFTGPGRGYRVCLCVIFLHSPSFSYKIAPLATLFAIIMAQMAKNMQPHQSTSSIPSLSQEEQGEDGPLSQRAVLLRSDITRFPHKPGCYLFKDKAGAVLYVGKAKNLRNRILQYFGADKRPQLPFLMQEATEVDYIVVETELESLFLENTLIKQYLPPYNIKLRDDKNYAFIKIDYSTTIPQIDYARKMSENTTFVRPHPTLSLPGEGKEGEHIPQIGYARKIEYISPLSFRASASVARNLDPSVSDALDLRMTQKTKYFGPYSSAKKIKQTLDFVRKIFPYCANKEPGKRACFYYYLHRCPGICVSAITMDEYIGQLKRIEQFLKGDTAGIRKELKREMQLASSKKQFERAARLRDQFKALQILDERQTMMFPSRVNWDFVSIFEEYGDACINLFKIREGKLIDKENFIYQKFIPFFYGRKKKEYIQPVIERFIETYYSETNDIPQGVYLELSTENTQLIETLLRTRANRKIPITIPTRGKKLSLIKLGKTNAQEYLKKWQSSQATNVDVINKTLGELQILLKLPTLPRRIECYDISNTQGTNPVGSMVVFVDGFPAKSEYRKFKIRSKDTPDDFRMMKETLSRRLAHLPVPLLRHPEKSSTKDLEIVSSPPKAGQNDEKKWSRPDLIVIDGGKGQLSAALEAQQESIVKSQRSNVDEVPMIGLAKKIEEIFLPHNPNPIILSHDEPALQMLQRLRDEAHRFGITFHRSLRSKQATKSALDTIPGIGPKTKKLLKQKFGTISNIRSATTGELTAVIGNKKALILKKNM